MALAETRDPIGELAARRAFEAAIAVQRQPPAKLGRFELLERIGKGSFGIVYRAHDPDLERDVAIKVVAGSAHRERLLEARAAAQLRHPNVVTVHDAGAIAASTCGALLGRASGPGVYIVMELVEGVDLGTWLEQAPRSRDEILAVLLEAGRGLAAAHQAGLVHRDFKPANVMVCPSGRVSVLDFGLALDLDAPEQSCGSGVAAGSPRYMAPEQHAGAAVGPSADQYAFCVTSYEALVGEPPFRGDDLLDLFDAKKTLRLRPAVLSRVDAALTRGLSFEASDRFESMDALLAQLQPRSRRVMVVTSLFAVGGLAAMLAAPASHAAGATCLDDTVDSGGLWDPATRDAVAAAFEGSQLPGAAASMVRLEPELEGFADAWTEQSRAVCGPFDSAQARCLIDQRERVAVLVDLLRNGDATALRHAVAAAESIPDPRRCSELGDPSAPAFTDAASARALGHAQVLAAAGRRADARAIVEPLLHDADVVVAARALDLQCALDRDDRETAYDACLRAALAHEALGADAAAVPRLTDAATSAYRNGQTEVAQATFALAQSKAERLGLPADARRQLALARVRMADDPEQALERAREAYATLGPGQARARVALIDLEARALGALGRQRDKIARLEAGLELARATLGESHPYVARMLNNLGVAERVAGEHARSAIHFREALALKQALGGSGATHNGSTLVNLGRTYLLLGNPAAASEPLRRARRLLGDDEHEREIIDHLLLAAAWRTDVRADRCEALDAIASEEAPNEAAPYWIETALCWHAAGRDDDANRALYRVDLDLTNANVEGRWWLAASRLAYATGHEPTARRAELRGRMRLHEVGSRADAFDALDGPIGLDTKRPG